MWRFFAAIAFLCCITVSISHAQMHGDVIPAAQQSLQPWSVSDEKTCLAQNNSQINKDRIACRTSYERTGSFNPIDLKSKYVPLSTRGKFNIFFRSTYDLSTFFSAAFEGTLAQAEGQWPGYGGGVRGWGKRIGASLADTEARRFVQSFALCSVLHQDPRYFRSRSHSRFVRAGYAVSRVMITRSDNGKNVFNSAELLGTLFTSSLQNAYYPGRQRGFNRTMERFWSSFSSDATSNLLKEFWPDIRRLLRKHAPDRIKELEERIPDSIEEKPAP
jgi:hypothetical protein